MKLLIGTLFLCYLLLVVLTGSAMYRRHYQRYTIMKTLASTGFLLIGAVTWLASGQTIYLALLPAYLCCFIGDVLLALSNEIDDELKNPQFTLGVAAFAIAHFFVIIEFGKLLHWQVGLSWVLVPLALFAYTIYTATAAKDRFCYGQNAVPSFVYALIVGLCGGMGWDLAVSHSGEPAMLLMGLGAVWFMISDFILAHKYFCITKKQRTGAGVLLFYYGAMGMLSAFPLLL